MSTVYNDPIMLDSTGQAIVNKLNQIADNIGTSIIDDTTTSNSKTWSSYKINNTKVDKVAGKGLSTNDYSNADKAIVDGVTTALAGKVNTSSVGTANGVAGLDNTGRVLSSQLPLGETQGTAYEGNKGKANADAIATIQETINGLGTASTKNSTSVVTESSDLVESGAVKDIVGWGNKNVLPNNGQRNGGTAIFTYNTDGTVQVTGSTDSDNSQFEMPLPVDLEGDYYFSGCPDGGGESTYDLYAWDSTAGARIKKWDGTSASESDYGESSRQIKLVKGHKNSIIIRVRGNQSNLNLLFKPMVSKNGLPYEPYHASVEEYCASKQLLEDTVGWMSDEQAKLYNWTGDSTGITFTYTNEQLTVNGTALANTSQPSSSAVPEDGKYTLKAGSYKLISDVDNVYWEVLSLNPVAFITQDSKPFTITEDTAVFIRANIKSGTSFNNKVVHVSLRKLSVDEQKADNSVIGTVEGANASKAWSVGEHFISGGQFKEVAQPIASGGAISDSNTVDKPIADCLLVSNTQTFSNMEVSANSFVVKTLTIPTGFTPVCGCIKLASGSGNASYYTGHFYGAYESVVIRNSDSNNHTWNISVDLLLKKS